MHECGEVACRLAFIGPRASDIGLKESSQRPFLSIGTRARSEYNDKRPKRPTKSRDHSKNVPRKRLRYRKDATCPSGWIRRVRRSEERRVGKECRSRWSP